MRRSSLVRGLSFLAWFPLAAAAQTQTAVFAGGCFWGVDAVFKHVRGVTRVVSGYSGGESSTAHYELVSEGTTGHAESVQVTFDASVVPYSTLLKVFFAVAHDPTTLNRQGPDEGTQYRSTIFFANADQQRVAQAAIAQLTKDKAYRRPIITQVVPLRAFYPAEDYHQDYLAHHLTQPYIVYNDLPKVEHLKAEYPDLYRP
ncbi:MAG TPA: peptide-methionine (S)-S-oxide reductase MsrA [Gemmatimonadaceae bacterium]